MAISTEGTYQDFAYTGTIQEYTIPYTGLYKLQVWGAQGQNSGGKGGYSIGYKELSKSSKVYIVVGGSSGFGGGGTNKASLSTGYLGSYYGGGASHFAFVTGQIRDIGKTTFDKQGLIVAGGGGGGDKGGAGGGLTGSTGTSDADWPSGVTGAGGGSQTSGGSQGGYQISQYGTWIESYANGAFGSGGEKSGGGGYYGGGGGVYYYRSCGGGGGSGWIGGVPKITYKGSTYSPSTSNGQNSGNGKARITLVKKGFPTITYNGTTLDGMIFNGTEVDTVVFNGVTLE